MVPALEKRFSVLSAQDVKDFESFCQVINSRREFGEIAANHSKMFVPDESATE